MRPGTRDVLVFVRRYCLSAALELYVRTLGRAAFFFPLCAVASTAGLITVCEPRAVDEHCLLALINSLHDDDRSRALSRRVLGLSGVFCAARAQQSPDSSVGASRVGTGTILLLNVSHHRRVIAHTRHHRYHPVVLLDATEV